MGAAQSDVDTDTMTTTVPAGKADLATLSSIDTNVPINDSPRTAGQPNHAQTPRAELASETTIDQALSSGRTRTVKENAMDANVPIMSSPRKPHELPSARSPRSALPSETITAQTLSLADKLHQQTSETEEISSDGSEHSISGDLHKHTDADLPQQLPPLVLDMKAFKPKKPRADGTPPHSSDGSSKRDMSTARSKRSGTNGRAPLSSRLLASAENLTSRTLSTFRDNLSNRSGPKNHSDERSVHEELCGIALRAALNQPQQIKELLLSGHDVNARDADGDRTPLHWAAARGYRTCVTALTAAGADVNARDASGRTPAELALDSDQPSIYELLTYGPPLEDPKRLTGKEGPCCLHAALGQPKQLSSCLRAAPPSNQRDDFFSPDRRDCDDDRCPIHWAAARGNVACLTLIIDAGANLGALDAGGNTAAGLALQLNQRRAHSLLMEAITDRSASPRNESEEAEATGAGADAAAFVATGAEALPTETAARAAGAIVATEPTMLQLV